MKTLLIILTLFFNFSCCSAQSFSTKQLQGTRWQAMTPKGVRISTWDFSSTEILTTTWYFLDTNPQIHSHKYYLSKNIPTSFNPKKVGKSKKGKYLVYKIDKTGLMFYEEIVAISDDSLKLFHKMIPGGIGDNDHYLLFRRLK